MTPHSRIRHEGKQSQHGERALWAAVILQAVADAQRPETPTSRKDNTRGLNRHHALTWLTTPSSDFNTVCALAGVDPDAVRERVRPLLSTKPGVGSNFADVSATGRPNDARDIRQKEISE